MTANRTVITTFALLASLALSVACATGTTTRGRSRDRNVLSEQELRENNFLTAYDAVAALRGNWLRERGADSFSAQTYVQVYIDSNRLGGVESLRQINVRDIVAIRWLDGVQAVQRYGIGHGQGAIVVQTIRGEDDAEQRRRAPQQTSEAPTPVHLASQRVVPAAGDSSYVTARGGNGAFPLAAAGRVAPIHVSAGDWPGVVRVARDLQADVERVTGATPALLLDSLPAARQVVLVGTLGRSPVIDRLVRERKVDTSRVAGGGRPSSSRRCAIRRRGSSRRW